MADNRQFADHVEIGGANVYFQETSTTDTTMPSTSFFKTEDVDGKPVIISRDNIMGIVKDCLGSILNGLTDQTTVTKVPTLNGDTLGASAVSTLASVLGVGLGFTDYGNVANINFNLFHKDEFAIAIATGNNTNAPISGTEVMWFFVNIPVCNSGDQYYGAIQFAFSWGQGVLYSRIREMADIYENWKPASNA